MKSKQKKLVLIGISKKGDKGFKILKRSGDAVGSEKVNSPIPVCGWCGGSRQSADQKNREQRQPESG